MKPGSKLKGIKLSAKQHVAPERPRAAAAAPSPLAFEVKGRRKVSNCYLVNGAKVKRRRRRAEWSEMT